MPPLRWLLAISLLLLVLQAGHADVRSCQCDPARPETMDARECSLCKVAEAQPPDSAYFLLKDSNPNKPNRWLALPRSHGEKPQDLRTMTAAERTAYWTFAIAEARKKFGDAWGLAINSIERRTQCHVHIHVGRLRKEGVEEAIPAFDVVDGPADIPYERVGDGLLVHPVGGKFHVHRGNDSPELQLDR
jgi:diadenosine tetraphosphate (Ap4A) HIT family hydrolase